MLDFLKTKTVDVNGKELQIHQLSGLARFEYSEWCADQPKPELPGQLSADASDEDKTAWEIRAFDLQRQWGKFILICQSRLVAYGVRLDIDDLDQRYELVMNAFSSDSIKFLHDEIAALSGMVINKQADVDTDVDTKEPVDPKS
jgi:hypothetical protein